MRALVRPDEEIARKLREDIADHDVSICAGLPPQR
jgi:hypothetical protein